MKKIIVFVLILCTQINFGQNERTIDSLLMVINTSSDLNSKLTAHLYLGKTYTSQGEYDEAIKVFKSGLLENEEDISDKNKMVLNTELAFSYSSKNRLDSALFYVDKAEIFFERIKKDSFINSPFNIKGSILRQMGNYPEAIKYGLKAAEQYIKFKDFAGAAASYNTLGNIYEKMNDYEKAKEQFINAINFLNQEKKNTTLDLPTLQNIEANILMNFGGTLARLNEYDEAIINMRKAKKLFEKLGNNHRHSYLNNNIGELYLLQKEYDSSTYYIKKSIVFKRTLKDKNDLLSSLNNLSKVYRLKGNLLLSLKYGQEALDINNDENVNLYSQMATNLNMSEIREKMGDTQGAFDFYKTYKLLSDSLINSEKAIAIVNLETKYQTKQKENEIFKLTSDNIHKEASLTQSRYAIFGALATLLLIIGLGYFYWNKRKQQHQFALLENSVKSSEAEKSRIGRELHDNIASTLMKLVHDSEKAQLQLSHKLLETYNEVRDLSHQLDNTPMHGELFIDRILDVIPENTKTQQFKFEITPRHLEINEPHGTHVFRIIQELIANNLKYANATQTQLSIALEKQILKLIYKDNGVGALNFEMGNGYKNIEDRLALMKGKLQIEHQEAFLVVLTIPYFA